MLQISCPHCGVRNSSEFRHAGERRTRPDVATVSPEQWRSYLYLRANVAGWVSEQWYHSMGCRRFISIERNTMTNETRGNTGEDAALAGGT